MSSSQPGSEIDPCGSKRYVAYPAALSGEQGPYYSREVDEILVAVGATTVYNSPGVCIEAAQYTCWASADTCKIVVDVSAPGGDTNLRMPACRTGFFVGYAPFMTSGAAATVTGIAALMFSLDPTLSPAYVKSMLRHNAKFRSSDCLEVYPARRCLKGKGFQRDYSGNCPFVEQIPEQSSPFVWPDGNPYTMTLESYDYWASPVFGSGMPDYGRIHFDLNSGGRSYFISGGILNDAVVISDCAAVYLYGDLEIASGGDLKIYAPVGGEKIVVKVAATDSESAGLDPELIEISVNNGGRLFSNTTLRVQQQLKAPENRMRDVRCASGGTLEIEGGFELLSSTSGLYIAEGGVLDAQSLVVESDSWGLETHENVSLEGIKVRSGRGVRLSNAVLDLTGGQNEIVCTSPSVTAIGMLLQGSSAVTSEVPILLRDWYYGFVVDVGQSDVSIPAITGVNCMTGIVISTARDVTIPNGTSFLGDGSVRSHFKTPNGVLG